MLAIALTTTTGSAALMAPQVFSQQAFAGVRKYFRYLLFTTEDSSSKLPRTLRFSFALPPMHQVCTLTSAIRSLLCDAHLKVHLHEMLLI